MVNAQDGGGGARAVGWIGVGGYSVGSLIREARDTGGSQADPQPEAKQVEAEVEAEVEGRKPSGPNRVRRLPNPSPSVKADGSEGPEGPDGLRRAACAMALPRYALCGPLLLQGRLSGARGRLFGLPGTSATGRL